MISSSQRYESCERTRQAIDECFDGDAAAQLSKASVAEHLSRCRVCRDYQTQLQAFEKELGSLPMIPFPEEALEAVFAQTVATDSGSMWRRPWLRWGNPLAAAAVLALCVTIPWTARRWGESLERERVARALVETRFVLGVTAEAFRRTESATIEDLYGKHLTGVMKRFRVDLLSKPFGFLGLGE